MRGFLKEFCANSTIHGVRYFTEPRRHWSERFWWAIAICVSFYFCGNSIRLYWMDWIEDPVTLNFAMEDKPVSFIPFPTIVICPRVKTAYESEFDVTLKDFFESPRMPTRSFTNIELDRLDAVGAVCDWQDIFYVLQNEFVNSSIYDRIRDIAPDNDIMDYCSLYGSIFGCSKLFTVVWTGLGLCFAFNALNSHEVYTEAMAPELKIVTENPNISHWNPDDGYETTTPNENEYPIRSFGAKKTGLDAAVRFVDKDMGSICESGIGMFIGIFVPGTSSIIRRDMEYIEINDQVANILIKPKLIITSEKLRRYTPKQRQCFFNFERQLRFFKIYTQINCKAECLANYTEKECKCVKYSMPREKSTKICGPGKIRCYKLAEIKLFGLDVIDGMKDKAAKDFREDCNCMPECMTITYDTEIGKIKQDGEPGEFSTVMSISYAEPSVVTLQRSESHTYTDFLGVCGGLFGLFLGISVLSIIEFAYYFTLRLFWSIRNLKSENSILPVT